MNRIFFALAVAASAAFGQQAQPATGSISGTLLGDDGSSVIGATIRLHLTSAMQPKTFAQQSDWEPISGSAGAFQLVGLPQGNYTLCPSLASSTWLNPCEWALTTPGVTISAAHPNPIVQITLHRGVAVPVRIDDTGQLLSQNEGRTPGAGLLLMISGPGQYFRMLPLLYQDSSGRNYQIVIPFNTALTLVIGSSFYHLNGPSGAALSRAASTQFPRLVAGGQQVAPIKFSVTGAGH